MSIRNFCVAATLCAGLAAIGVAQAAVQVSKWPDDVPCDAISREADGSYTLNVAITLVNGDIIPAGLNFQTTDEYSVWTTKCGG